MGLNEPRKPIAFVKSNKKSIVAGSAIILVVLIFIILIGVLFFTPGKTTLTIYTYDSLINWGLDPDEANRIVFETFETTHDIKIELRYFAEANYLLTIALEEKNDPQADIIIGLDNILYSEAKKHDLFERYDSPVLTNISSSLINILDPEHYLLPYDYGSIALFYDTEYFNETYGLDKTYFDQLNLTDLLDEKFAKELILIDPTQSSTGLSFFLWTVAVCEYTPAGQKPGMTWEQWWEAIDEHVQIEASWTEAFELFYSGAVDRHMMISYATDGAYNQHFGYPFDLTACITHENGESGDNGYGWLQVEGLGIIKGTEHQELARKFVDWFLGPTVQDVLPLNQWMYPANTKVTLPAAYDYAVNISKIEHLNNLVPKTAIENNLGTWLDSWETIVIEG